MDTRLLTFALAALLAGPASAQTASLGKGKVEGPLLTRAELRECIAQQNRLRTDTDALRTEREKLEAEKVELQRQGDVLREQLAALDRTDADAVDGYNQRALARDVAIEAFETRMTAYNAKAEAGVAQREAFAKNCENRRYDEQDEAAIRKGK